MKKVYLSFVAVLGLLAGLSLTASGTATATPSQAGTTVTPAATCTHWQYKIKKKSGIYKSATLDESGDRPFATAYKGYYFNIHYPRNYSTLVNGIRYRNGTVYTHRKQKVATGSVNASRLDYVSCW